MTSQAVRRVAPLAAGAAVLALVVGTTYLLRDGGSAPGSADLPLLRIGAGTSAADSASTKDRVIVSATLPAGPDSSRVYRFGSALPDPARLADALDLAPSQVRTGQAVTTDQGTVLRVGTGRGAPWQFARAGAYVCLDQLVGEGSDGSVSSTTCAAPPPSSKPAPVDPPSDADAIAAARPVLAAVGLDADDATVEPASSFGTAIASRTVRVDPAVDGAPTSGFATSVTADASGVVTASGWLAPAQPSDSYPVIGARDAVDRLAAMPVPLMACAETVPIPPGPACGGPLEVIGASFGRSLQWEGSGDKALLVPSWLFDIKGATEPIAIVAVDPAFLEDPLPADPGGGSSGSGGTAVPGSPGTAGPGAPATPVAPAVEPSPTSRFESVAAADGDAALRVTFYGGVDSCYTYDVVAKESVDEVALELVEKRTADICIDMAQQYERVVKLARPLGDRRVVDAVTDSRLFVDGATG